MRSGFVVCVLVLFLSGCLQASEPPPEEVGETPPEPHDPGWPEPEAAPLRPGAKLFDSFQNQVSKAQAFQCTLNFIFSDPNNTTLYVGTASHCVAGFKVGDRLALADGAAHGTLAYCSLGTIAKTDECPNLGVIASDVGANDFALIEVDPEDRDKVHPATFRIGGPTHLAAVPAEGTTVYTYGNTDSRDGRVPAAPDTLDARAGRVHNANDWIVEIIFGVTSLGGDSGSPVLDADGGALGVLQYAGTVQCPGPRADVNGAVLLRSALEYLHANTGLSVELKTWPLLEPPAPLPEAPWPCDGALSTTLRTGE